MTVNATAFLAATPAAHSLATKYQPKTDLAPEGAVQRLWTASAQMSRARRSKKRSRSRSPARRSKRRSSKARRSLKRRRSPKARRSHKARRSVKRARRST